METIKDVSNNLKCSPKEVVNKAQMLVQELKEKEREINELKKEIAKGAEGELLNQVKEVNGVKYIAAAVENMDSENLRELGDRLRDKLQSGVVVLGSVNEDKVVLLAMATKDAVAKGVHCGKIIKEVATIAGGGGGGRPDMAQAGGKKPEKLNEAINLVEKLLETLVK